MEWFNDQPLRPRPHIAVLFYDALGDFVIITPLLRGLKEKYPDCTLDYFSGERTRELEEALPYIDARFSVFGNPNALTELPAFLAERRAVAGEYDLVINCDFHPTMAFVAHMLQPRYVVGKCYAADLREEVPRAPGKVHQLHDEFWSAPDLLQRYGDILRSTYIGEIWCRLAFVETDFYRTEVPTQDPACDIPEVVISTGGRRPAKLWSRDYWKQVIDWCFGQGFRVGLVGDKPQRQSAVYHTGDTESWLLEQTPLIDLRGQFSLPQVAGALARARACVSVDNGIMHIAYSVRTPTIALFGASPWMVWTPPCATPALGFARRAVQQVLREPLPQRRVPATAPPVHVERAPRTGYRTAAGGAGISGICPCRVACATVGYNPCRNRCYRRR
jgi:heptosyltransferase-3